MELFDEQGFERTSVGEIAERARVTTRTFFRYFPDKREVLFARADDLRTALVEGIRRAPDVEEPLRAVVGVLAGFDWAGQEREVQRRRNAVIGANPELLERDLSKQHDIAAAFAEVLRDRGVDPADRATRGPCRYPGVPRRLRGMADGERRRGPGRDQRRTSCHVSARSHRRPRRRPAA